MITQWINNTKVFHFLHCVCFLQGPFCTTTNRVISNKMSFYYVSTGFGFVSLETVWSLCDKANQKYKIIWIFCHKSIDIFSVWFEWMFVPFFFEMFMPCRKTITKKNDLSFTLIYFVFLSYVSTCHESRRRSIRNTQE